MAFGAQLLDVLVQHSVLVLQHVGQHLVMESRRIDGLLDVHVATLLPQHAHEQWHQRRYDLCASSCAHNQTHLPRRTFCDNHWAHRGHGTRGAANHIPALHMRQIEVVVQMFHGVVGHGVVEQHSRSFAYASAAEAERKREKEYEHILESISCSITY